MARTLTDKYNMTGNKSAYMRGCNWMIVPGVILIECLAVTQWRFICFIVGINIYVEFTGSLY